jgi:hypothetical protein
MKQISGGGDADTSKLIDPSRYPRPVSKYPKPKVNADPEVHDAGYGQEVPVAPQAQFPLGFSGATPPPEEGNRQGAGGHRDIFKVGDGTPDFGEGYITVNKANGEQEKRPLKTGPQGGKYYEDEAGRKHYVGGEGRIAPTAMARDDEPMRREPGGMEYTQPAGAPSEEEIDAAREYDEVQNYVASNRVDPYSVETGQAAAAALKKLVNQGIATDESHASMILEGASEEISGPSEEPMELYSVREGWTAAGKQYVKLRNEGMSHQEAIDVIRDEGTRAGEEPIRATPEAPTGDWSDRFGDVVAEYRMGLTNPENRAVEKYISALDVAEPSQKQDAYMNFSEDLQDEGWKPIEAYQLATELYNAHMKQRKKGEEAEDDEDDIKKANEILDDMVKTGEITTADREKVLPAAVGALVRLAAKPAVAAGAGYLAGKQTDEGTTTFPGTAKQDDEEDEDVEKANAEELLRRGSEVGEEVGAASVSQAEQRAHGVMTDPAREAEAVGRKASQMIRAKGDTNVMDEMHKGIQENGRVTYLKMMEDKSKALQRMLDKSDISQFNVMKDMGIDEARLSDELQKTNYMIEVLHER